MTMYLNASDVAAAIGFNRFKSRDEIYQKYKKTQVELTTEAYDFGSELINNIGTEDQIIQLKTIEDSSTIQKEALLIEKCKLQTEIKHIEDIIDNENTTDDQKVFLKVHKEVCIKDSELVTERVLDVEIEAKQLEANLNKEVITNITRASVNTKLTTDSVKLEHELTNTLNNVIPSSIMPKVSQMVTSTINTQRGILNEEHIVNDTEEHIGKKIKARNSKLYYITCGNIKIGGRIDGFIEDTRSLVEVKRRRNRFLGVPKYELIQCEVYMRMLNVNNCLHVEEYNGISQNVILSSSDNIWEEIIQGLESYEAFCDLQEL